MVLACAADELWIDTDDGSEIWRSPPDMYESL